MTYAQQILPRCQEPPCRCFDPSDIRLAIVLASSRRSPSGYITLGPVIGHITFHPWFAVNTWESGWVFHPAYQGQGLATEAARAVMNHAFDMMQIHRLIATCQPQNPVSWRVMEKLGMRREGHFLCCIHRGGDIWWDEYFYALLAEERLPESAADSGSLR